MEGSTSGGVLGRGGVGKECSASNGGGVSGGGGTGGELDMCDTCDTFECSMAGGAGFAERALGDCPNPVTLLLALLFSSSDAGSGEMVTKFCVGCPSVLNRMLCVSTVRRMDPFLCRYTCSNCRGGALDDPIFIAQ